MADLAASAVTTVQQLTFGGTGHKDVILKRVVLTLATMGTTTNKVPASAFGFSVVVAVYSFVKNDNTRLLAVPSFDNTHVLLMDPVAATNAAADFTGTFEAVVIGY